MDQVFIDTNKEYLTKDFTKESIPENMVYNGNGSPLCSVIIPSFNYGKYLPDTISSVLNQSLNSFEIIIVDDGSTDKNTIDAVKKYIGVDGVTVIFQENRGVSVARNKGISIASGKYICCLDSDDIIMPTYLEQCIFELEVQQNLGFVYSWVQLFGEETRVWQTQDFCIERALTDNQTCVAAVFRKTDWQLCGGYNTAMIAGFEDWEFWLRLSQLGRAGKSIKAPLFFYRRHEQPRTNSAEKSRTLLEDIMKENNKALYEKSTWLDYVKLYVNSQASALTFPKLLQSPVGAKKQDDNLFIFTDNVNLFAEDKVFKLYFENLSKQKEVSIFIFGECISIMPPVEEKLSVRVYFCEYYENNREYTKIFVRYFIEAYSPEIILYTKDVKINMPDVLRLESSKISFIELDTNKPLEILSN